MGDKSKLSMILFYTSMSFCSPSSSFAFSLISILLLFIDSENILFLSYEWMKANHYAAVGKIAKFIGCDLTPSVISSIVDQTNFKTMKTNPAVNMSWADSLFPETTIPFIHTGKVGNWKNYFTDEQSTRMNEEIKKKLDGTGLEFEYS